MFLGFIWGLESYRELGKIGTRNVFVASGIWWGDLVLAAGTHFGLPVFALGKLILCLVVLFRKQWSPAFIHILSAAFASLMIWVFSLSNPLRLDENVRGLADSFFRHADVAALRTWAGEMRDNPELIFDHSEIFGTYAIIDKTKWPPFVQVLSPSNVTIHIIDETRHSLRLQYGGVLFGRWGVHIMSQQDHLHFDERLSEWLTIYITPKMLAEGVFAFNSY